MCEGDWDGKLNVLLVGGGMISLEVIIPTLFQERRDGNIGEIGISSLDAKSIKRVQETFPGVEFTPYPDPARVDDPEKAHPDLFKEAMDKLDPADSLVIVATPDHLHTPIIMEAIERGLDVVCEKPLCLKVEEAHRIQKAARDKGVYIYTDYHKRHDRACRAARYRYRKGDLGQMLHGHAWIEEKKEMPLVNFAVWARESSSFEYIGVHYADIYYFVTGLLPKRLVAFAQKKFLPTKGKDVWDAVQAAIEWEDGSVFWIQTSWVLPQSNSSLTNQGMQLTGTKGEHKADHKDRNCYFITDDAPFEHYNPNFFKPYDSWNHPGDVDWTGYGYDSIVQGIDDIRDIKAEVMELDEKQALARRKELLDKYEEIRPLPSQALVGTAINEGVRLSFENGSRWVEFDKDLYPKVT